MTWVAAAIVGGAVIGGVGSAVAGSKQAGGEKAAANTQAGMFNTITGQEQPYLTGGYGAEDALNYLLGTGPVGSIVGKGKHAYTLPDASELGTSLGLPEGYLTKTFNPTTADLESYPGYQFQLNVGQAATQNANTPGLGALSGPALKELMSFNQGLAASNYQNYFNQFQSQQNNIFNRLSDIAALGQNAAGNLGNSGTQLGQGIASAQAGGAAATAGGIVGAANSVGNSVPLGILLANGGLNGASGASGGGYVDTASGSSVPAGYYSTPGYTG